MTRFPFQNRELKGFNNMELLVTLIVIGILMLIASPYLMGLVTRAKSMEAKMQLQHLHELQKAHFMRHSEYGSELSEIGFKQRELKTNDGNANYKIKIVEAGPKGFVARAKAVVDFDKDGQVNIWEIDEEKDLKEVQPD